MKYADAEALIKGAHPELELLPEDGNHIAIKRAGTKPPFCIALPNVSHAYPDLTPAEVVEAENKFILDSVIMMEKM